MTVLVPLRRRERRRVGEHADGVAVHAVRIVHRLEREQVAERRAIRPMVRQLERHGLRPSQRAH